MNSLSVTVAGVQLDIKLGDVPSNLDRIAAILQKRRHETAELVVLPECSLTGYCFSSRDEAVAAAQPVDGQAVRGLCELAEQHRTHIVAGMLELSGGDLYNTAVLVGPDGLVGRYRKTHLPFLGVDRFVTPGDELPPVFDVGAMRVGVCICYDASFPETVRSLALRGADLVVLPTNWPCGGAEGVAEHLPSMRAMENHIFFLVVNRVGSEGGFQFLGTSKFCTPSGQVEAVASSQSEDVIVGMVQPEVARNKRIEREPGPHIIDRFADRRPEHYAHLIRPTV